MLERIKQHKQKVDETRDIYTKLDANDVPEGKNEIRLFVIARNESLRLPYFLKYYSEMGVDRFFLIDNNSTDNTVEIACAQKNVHVFQIKKSFKEFWYWVEYFLEQYGKNRWCIVVDVDELLFFPFKEKLSFKEFINYLEEKKYTAFRAFLLDMYSDKAINDTVYFPGDDPLKTCPFFDTEYTQQIIHFFDKKKWENFKWPLIYGGVRQRLFGKINNGNWVFCLTKAPLLSTQMKFI